MGGRLDFVTVGGPDHPPLQFGKGGQEIVVGTEIWQMAGAQVTGEILHEAEATLAGKGEEVVAAGQLGEDGDTVGLEEVTPGLGGLENAQSTEGGEGEVVKGIALAGDAGGLPKNNEAENRP